MAIQLPNPGLGDGQTGDNEFVMWTKVKDNFNNQTHAASRLVGNNAGNLLEVGAHGLGSVSTVIDDNVYVSTLRNGFYTNGGKGVISYGQQWTTGFRALLELPTDYDSRALSQIRVFNGGEWTGKRINDPSMAPAIITIKIYTDQNTTKDSATGFLKVSSPVLHVYNDSITKIHEAEQLDITVDKKGVGHYEIHGTTGLRKNDGWFMSPPRDVHGNVLCMVALEEKDGIVILKTYKKKFDFETVSIVHDYDNPTDIPDGVCVEFRFNDLPEELINEPIE